MAESASGFHVPSISEFFPDAFWLQGTPFEINRVALVRFVVAALLMLWLWLATRHAKIIPSRAQSLIEVGLDFVRVQIAESVLGKEEARKWLPMLTTIFFMVLAMNIASVVPFLNIAGTAVSGMPVVLALWVYVMYLATGLRRHGLGYLKQSLFPPGVPAVMYVLITPIEFLQVFVLRPLTLALRLLANMMAGHLMLVLCFAATQFLLIDGGGMIKLASSLTFVGGLLFTLFEAFVAFLQAFIFALLAAVYIQMAVEEEH